jgi:hypothetical protein
MISNITPEDRETWDKKMKDHARRLDQPARRRRNALAIITGFVIGWFAVVAWNWCNKPYIPARTPERVMEDTAKAHGFPDSAIRFYWPTDSTTMRPQYNSANITGWGFEWGHRIDRKTTYAITFDFGTVAWAVGLKGKWHVVDTCRWDAFNDLVKSYKVKRPKGRYSL